MNPLRKDGTISTDEVRHIFYDVTGQHPAMEASEETLIDISEPSNAWDKGRLIHYSYSINDDDITLNGVVEVTAVDSGEKTLYYFTAVLEEREYASFKYSITSIKETDCIPSDFL